MAKANEQNRPASGLGFLDLLLNPFRPKWKHSDPDVRRQWLTELPALGELSVESAAALADCATTDRSDEIRVVALRRMQLHPESKSPDYVDEAVASAVVSILLDAPTPAVRAAAQAALAARGQWYPTRQLFRLHESASPALREQAAKALRKRGPAVAKSLGSRFSSATPLLRSQLGDDLADRVTREGVQDSVVMLLMAAGGEINPGAEINATSALCVGSRKSSTAATVLLALRDHFKDPLEKKAFDFALAEIGKAVATEGLSSVLRKGRV